MKNNVLKKHLTSMLLSVGVLLVPVAISAQTTTFNSTDECSKELLLSYFPDVFVSQTLKKYNVPQDKWSAISKGLAAKDKDVLKIVEEKASKLSPNPFKDRDPAQRQIAVKIFRETLTQVFNEVLKANGVTDEKQLSAMLDDIQQQKAKNFALCMEKQKQNIQSTPSNAQSPSKSTVLDNTDSTMKSTTTTPQFSGSDKTENTPDNASDDSNE